VPLARDAGLRVAAGRLDPGVPGARDACDRGGRLAPVAHRAGGIRARVAASRARPPGAVGTCELRIQHARSGDGSIAGTRLTPAGSGLRRRDALHAGVDGVGRRALRVA
jgi:hypothetical protein